MKAISIIDSLKGMQKLLKMQGNNSNNKPAKIINT